MKSYRLLLSMFALALLFVMPGCLITSNPPPDGTGSIRVDWTFRDAQTCPPDVDDVVIVISGHADITRPCSDGSYVVDGLAPGHYTVHLKGLDGAAITWESQDAAFDVTEDHETPGLIDLDPLP